jgi:hypothetical protein
VKPSSNYSKCVGPAPAEHRRMHQVRKTTYYSDGNLLGSRLNNIITVVSTIDYITSVDKWVQDTTNWACLPCCQRRTSRESRLWTSLNTKVLLRKHMFGTSLLQGARKSLRIAARPATALTCSPPTCAEHLSLQHGCCPVNRRSRVARIISCNGNQPRTVSFQEI